ncbi:MAG: hypothetical protein ACKVWR_04665 [Acidimicrobiales bacterium]
MTEIARRNRPPAAAPALPAGRISRRRLLAGAGAAALLAACGSSDGEGSGSSGDEHVLIPVFDVGRAGPMLRTGIEQRTVWTLAGADGAVLSEGLPAALSFTLSLDGQQVGAPLEATRHEAGVPRPYYPLRFTVAQPGVYTAAVDFRRQRLEQQFLVGSPEQVPLVQPGEAAIPTPTPTTTDARGVRPICTRNPVCPFHEVSLADALGQKRPTALLISTPAFCQTAVCGPVLETLVEAAPSYPGVTFVHGEVYSNGEELTGDLTKAKIAEVVTAYKLTFEPSLVVIGADGKVLERLDFAFDRTETTSALDRLR